MNDKLRHERNSDDHESRFQAIEQVSFQNGPLATNQPPAFRFPRYSEIIEHRGACYFIGQEIGSGSFGRAFECTDEWGNSLVAKVLMPRGRPYEEIRAEWSRELQNLIAFRHPNVTYVYDAFEYQNAFYLIIEGCAETVRGIMQGLGAGLIGDNWIPHIARDVLQALDFMHFNKMVHKDIHSGNVFAHLSHDKMVPTREPVWTFKVGDLGISRLETEIHFFNTVLAPWMLPLEYLSPAEFGLVDRRVDIYHVALLLLSLAIGHEPQFSQSDIIAGAPRQLAEQLSSRFGPAISRALRRHVNQRTQTAMDFWRDLVQADNTRSQSAPCLEKIERARS